MAGGQAFESPASVLVYVGVDLLGDGLIKLPFLRALRHAYPTARITWVAGAGRTVFAGALAPLVTGLIDEVIENAGFGWNWWELFRRPLGGRTFDLVIDTQRRLLTTLIVKRVRHRRFISSAGGWIFSDRHPFDRKKQKKPLAWQLLQLVEVASNAPASLDVSLVIDPKSEAEARSLLPDGPHYIGLAPGASKREKCWPLENYLALAMRQIEAGRVPVFLLGPLEREWEAEVRTAVPRALLPLTDASSPLLTIALGRRLRAAVANDSGAGHLLAAADVPLVTLFGPSPADKFPPMTGHLTLIRAQDYGGDEIARIPLAPVVEALERTIEELDEIA